MAIASTTSGYIVLAFSVRAIQRKVRFLLSSLAKCPQLDIMLTEGSRTQIMSIRFGGLPFEPSGQSYFLVSSFGPFSFTWGRPYFAHYSLLCGTGVKPLVN